jgi:hypothetical protein
MITDQEALVPETEEDIERAEWRVVKDILNGTEPLYQSLRKLLESL